MKKILFYLAIFVVVLSALTVYNQFFANFKLSGTPSTLTTNPMDYVMGYATNTQSYCAGCPVKVLNKAVSRQFAYIATDSVKPIYLFFPAGKLGLNVTNSTTAPETYTNYVGTIFTGKATGTITNLNEGLKIVATTSPVLIDLSNQINSEIWASSTPEAGVQTIRVMYVQ